MKTPFNLSLIAKKSNHSEEQVSALLEKLQEKEIIEYKSKNNDATILFNEVREDDLTINRVSKYLEKQNKLKTDQLSSVIYYIKENKTCKNRLVLAYFGEETTSNCGVCSYCITQKGKITEADSIADKILSLLKTAAMTSREIQNQIKLDAKDVLLVLQELLENNHITILANNKYTLKT
jgi:ATP-dependent DNA helicase RecQ